MVLIASVGEPLAGNGCDAGIHEVPKRIEVAHMSQRERGPRVLSPLSSRNGNPICPGPIRCVLFMRVLHHESVGQRVDRCEPSISQRIGSVEAPLPHGHLGSTHPLLCGVPLTLPRATILPGVTPISIILPDQLFLLNYKWAVHRPFLHNNCCAGTSRCGGPALKQSFKTKRNKRRHSELAWV